MSPNFLVLRGHFSIAGTGAAAGMLDIKQIANYCEGDFSPRGLGDQVGMARPWCQGIGGAVTTLFSAAMLVGMGPIAGLIQVAVVGQGQTPFQTPSGIFRRLKVRI